MMTNSPTKLTKAIAMGLLLTPALAHAHPGHSSGLLDGVAHPISGVDHIAAMIGVGLWAAQLGGRARLVVPLAFLAAMLLGGVVATAGVVLPGVEQGVVASVLIIGLLMAIAGRLPLPAAMALVAAFALFHGVAHGSEMPPTADAGSYIAGFLTATAALQACGVVLGTLMTQTGRPVWIRFAGAAVFISGVMSFTAGL